MKPEERKSISQILERALQLSGTARRHFLRSACGDDARLRREVESLIEADHQAGDFLLQPLLDPLARSRPGLRAPIPDRIGPYKLLGPLGQGGMSVVYQARRDDESYRQQVALKLMRHEIATDAQLRRFRTERQILANLGHPNIARLLDGGTTRQGLPYFVMEFVQGKRIDEYCDAHRLTIEQRLDLFAKICPAVHYAHQNLVVHRDIKPSNILVTEEGMPKLLDFGIAKLLDPHSLLETASTAPWLRVMTPDYASPEQFQARPVSTASDIYSLGVLLYELLTGRLPYQLAGKAPGEIERILTQEDPLRPSLAFEKGTQQQARLRRCSPDQLRKLLAGDLDNVILKALRKEPSGRYESALQFGEDLARHRVGHPVLAHPDSLGYRTRKFLRRNRLASGVAAAFLILAALSIALLTLQSSRIAHQRDQAQRERDKAQAVADFLKDVFGGADPLQNQGDQVTARQLLDRGASRVEQVQAPPDVQAAFMHTIGGIYLNLGLYDQAEELLEKSYQIRLQRLGRLHPEVAESLHELGHLSYRRGDFDLAVSRFREAEALRRASGSASQTALAQGDLAVALQAKGQIAEAEKLYLDALQAISGSRDQDPEFAHIQVNFAHLLVTKGEFGRAGELLQDALTTYRISLGEKHPSTVMTLNNLAANRYAQGDHGGAIEDFSKALEIQKELLGEGHADVGLILNNLSALHYLEGDYPLAVQMGRQALSIRRKTLGHEHPSVAESLINLGSALRDQGQYQSAEDHLRSGLAIWQRHLGDHHLLMAHAWSNLAELLHQKGDGYPEAERLFRQALELRMRQLAPDHPHIARTQLGLGRLLTTTGELQEARRLLSQAVEIRRQRFPQGHLRTAVAENDLGDCLARLGLYQEAEGLLLKSFQVIRQQPPHTLERMRARARLFRLYTAWGKPEQAKPYKSS